VRTIDGGATWTIQTSNTTKLLDGVAFIDSIYGWAVGGSGTIVRTIDGGATWTLQTAQARSALFGL
jgi:photosystem II stability/assembly factor-like uncharacterized protein